MELVFRAKSVEFERQMVILESYLGLPGDAEVSFDRAKGSCEWIDSRNDFQEWRDSAGVLLPDDTGPSIPAEMISVFWVSANPGTGKTFLASYVADQLANSRFESASYFFHIGNKSSNVAHLLRSVACQIASSNATIRQRLLEFYDKGFIFDKDDAATIWAKFYKKGIFLVSKASRLKQCLLL